MLLLRFVFFLTRGFRRLLLLCLYSGSLIRIKARLGCRGPPDMNNYDSGRIFALYGD